MNCKSCDKETSIRNVEGDCPDCECIKGQSKIIKTQAERITELEGVIDTAIKMCINEMSTEVDLIEFLIGYTKDFPRLEEGD